LPSAVGDEKKEIVTWRIFSIGKRKQATADRGPECRTIGGKFAETGSLLRRKYRARPGLCGIDDIAWQGHGSAQN
jgi:hypothetical protein